MVWAGNTDGSEDGFVDLSINPIILKFYGAKANEKELTITSSTFSDSQAISSLDDVCITFNYDIELKHEALVEVYEGSEVFASSSELHVKDGNTLVVHFDNIPAESGHNYTLILKENTVCCKDDVSAFNQELQFTFKGAYEHYFGAKRILPRSSQPSLLEEIQVFYDFPEGCGFVYRGDDFEGYPMKVYKGDATDNNYLTTIFGNSSDNESLVFRPNFDIKAESTYTFVIEEGEVKAWIIGAANEKALSGYIGQQVSVTYNTPNISDIPKVTILDFEGEMSRLSDVLKINIEPYRYAETDYVVETSDVMVDKDVYPGHIPLYEIKGGKESLIGYYFFYTRNTKNDGCYLDLSIFENQDIELLSDREYEFRFPADMYYANQKLLKKYSGNEAFTYRIKGMTDANFTVTVSGSDGHTTKTIASRHQDVVLTFEAPEGRTIENVTLNGEPIELSEGNYTIDDITADAYFYITLNEVEPIVVEPQYVNISLTIGKDENHAPVYVHPTVKNKDAKVNLSAGALWKLSALNLNDEAIDIEEAADSYYIIPADKLNEDAYLVAEFAYNGSPMFDFTTSVNGIVEGCDYKVYSEGETLVIENVPANAHVAIYSVAGMLVKEGNNNADSDMLRINLNPGVYVVIIGQDALKIKH